MSNPNEKIAVSEQNSDNLSKAMDEIQWITEPALDEVSKEIEPAKSVEPIKEDPIKSVESVKEEPVKSVQFEPTKHVESIKEEPTKNIEQFEPIKEESTKNVEEKHSQEPETSKEVNELTRKVRAVELSDEEDEYVVNPPRIEKDENGFQFYKCRFCGLTYNFISTLKAHERSHGVDTPYLCPKCNESFHFMCELEYHAKTHEKQKGYKCDCGRTFYQYTDLLYHKHPGEDPDPEPLRLPMPRPPSRGFSRPPIEASAFPTPEFAEKGFEPKHPMKVYSDVRSKPYICQYCSKSYSNSRELAYHMYSHRGERTFNPRASRYLMARNENSYMSPGADVERPYV